MDAEEQEIKILGALPCKVGEDFDKAVSALGIEKPFDVLNHLFEKDLVTMSVDDEYVLTDKGKNLMEEYKADSRMQEKMDELQKEHLKKMWEAKTKKWLSKTVWKSKKIKIHPVLDFKDQAYTTQIASVESANSSEIRPILITSNGYYCSLDDVPSNIEFEIDTSVGVGVSNCWSIESIRSFLKGTAPKPTIRQAFDAIYKEYDYYIDMPETILKLLSLWALGTYFFPIFGSYPYIQTTGPADSGKTKVLQVTMQIAFQPQPITDPTMSYAWRVVEYNRPTMLIDEGEMKNINKSELRNLLLTGYKDAKFQRGIMVEYMVGKVKRFKMERMGAFCPKMLANISGLDDVLATRCITINMLRTNSEKGNRNLEPDSKKQEFLKRWQDTRDLLYLNMMNNWKEVKRVYGELETKEYSGIIGRNWELWLPILSLAKTVSEDLFNKMLEFAKENVEQKKESEVTETKELSVLQAVCAEVDESNWYRLSDLLSRARQFDELEDIKSRTMRKLMTSMSLIEKRKKSHGRIQVYISLDKLKRIASKYGVDYNKVREGFDLQPKTPEKRSFWNICLELEKEFGGVFDREVLIERAKKNGFDEARVEEMVEKMLVEGYLYNPEGDKIKIIRKSEGKLTEWM